MKLLPRFLFLPALLLGGCAGANFDAAADAKARREETDYNRQVQDAYRGSGIAAPDGYRGGSATSTGRVQVSGRQAQPPPGPTREIVDGSSAFYLAHGRWPKTRAEVQQGLQGPAEFVRELHLTFEEQRDGTLVVQYANIDGNRRSGRVTVMPPRG